MRKVLLLLSLATVLGLSGCFKRGPEIAQTPLSIAVSTNNSLVGIGQSATITAVVYDQNNRGVQWSASPLNFGTLSKQTFAPSTLTATVTYTAPTGVANPANVTVTATSITNPNITSSVSLHFSPLAITLQNNLVGVPLAPVTLNPFDRIQLFAAVTNDLSNLGVTYSLSPATGSGSLTILDNFTSLYFAPTVSVPTTVVVTATSVKDPTVTASQKMTIFPAGAAAGPNVVVLDVNGGPVPGRVYPNRAFTSILLCNPGSVTTCQTIDGILVDTGSYGLRILDSEMALLNLPKVTDEVGNVLENCASWPDGSFLWGPVSTADLYIGGEAATLQFGGVRPAVIQVISSKPAVVPGGCTNGATASDNTPELLGANGILGIGPEPTDCTLSGVNYCDGSTQQSPPNLYYACPTSGCTAADSPVTVNALQQVSNPVPLFSDSNGVIIQLPAVSDPQVSAMGTMTFGIGTESNNNLSAANILTLDANDNFTTIFNGQLLTNSFIDSGSGGLFFPDDSLPSCTVNKQFYCPTSLTMLSATNVGQTGQSTVNFSVENADSLMFAFSQDSVFPTFAGSSQIRGPCPQASVICVFDWGLPFFYGRTVYVGIDGKAVPNAPSTPWWAY